MGFEAVAQMGTDLGQGIITVLVYGVPFFAMLLLLGALAFFLRLKKLYKFDVIIDDWTGNNMVRRYDKGGIFKNVLGSQEFRLKKLKQTCNVPPMDCRIVQGNGRLGVHFDRFTDDDFIPKVIKKDLFKEPSFELVNPDTKAHLITQAKVIAEKNKRKKEISAYTTMVVYGGFVVLAIFCTIWYFKYAGVLAEKQINCLTPDTAKIFFKELVCQATETVGMKSPLTS